MDFILFKKKNKPRNDFTFLVFDICLKIAHFVPYMRTSDVMLESKVHPHDDALILKFIVKGFPIRSH